VVSTDTLTVPATRAAARTAQPLFYRLQQRVPSGEYRERQIGYFRAQADRIRKLRRTRSRFETDQLPNMVAGAMMDLGARAFAP
jgi:hypothetical protein